MELEQVPHVRGMVTGLNEILTNLLLNAVDATPDGGSMVRFRNRKKHLLHRPSP